LVPVQPSKDWIDEIRQTLTEKPTLRRKRLQAAWGFADLEFRDVLNSDLLDEIEATVSAGASPQAARKWWTGELARLANAQQVAVQDLPITPEQVASIQKLIDAGGLTDRIARDVVAGVLAGEGEPAEVIESRGLKVVTDEGELIAAIDKALASQPDVMEKIRDGKLQAAGAVIGAVMKEMRGQADAARVRELILERAK
jgi:aspartyl-tRNA(Asn)/glutamyl-tRNA(Gln) amidotransferase subunit B